jgi:uncharacterized protein YjbJ (UPF0337 family)
MNWDIVAGDWKQFAGKIKQKWGQLTDDELTRVGGKREQLEGMLQARYGYRRSYYPRYGGYYRRGYGYGPGAAFAGAAAGLLGAGIAGASGYGYGYPNYGYGGYGG